MSPSSSSSRVFQDIPDEIDETWTHGFVIGGMASAVDDLDIARAYKQAAQSLVGTASKSGEAWSFAYPILFLYRHALELYLKAVVRLVQPTKLGHGLRPLVQELDKLLRTRFQQRLPPDFRKDLLVFAKIDPDSQVFRYSRTTSSLYPPIPVEYWVPLGSLVERMEALCGGLERVYHELRERTRISST